MAKSPFSSEYEALCQALIATRRKAGLTQMDVASRLNRRGFDLSQSMISKIERLERRLDVVEFIMFARAIDADPAELTAKIECAFPAQSRKRGARRTRRERPR